VRFAAYLVCTVVLASLVLAAPAEATPFDGRGMWIWDVGRSAGGSPAAIGARGGANGIKTLFIKSGDGVTYWSQFSRSLVRSLSRWGLRVCAWQYVYGTYPATEAAVGARAVRNGADCLVIDAEAEYEGRYASAQIYIDALRRAVGRRYPVGLSSFPYVDYHPGFPYSVFLGHGGATFNLPQMYWRDIGSSVASVYRHTYIVNGIYRRPIRPVGQTYNGASASEIELFRGMSVYYRAGGLSWWDFAWTSFDGLWPAVSGLYTGVSRLAPLGVPILHYGSRGDMVLWMQQLLKSTIRSQRTTGTFASETLANLRRFQRRYGIPATGETGPRTWRALLRQHAFRVRWAAADAHSAHHGPRRQPATAAPQSANLPARRYEIHKLTGRDGGVFRG
jgi:peptidoglycan hydrolase-like protein with peptidoglycan-binding domain